MKTKSDIAKQFELLKKAYPELKNDPWGLDLDFCQKTAERLLPFYNKYFNVKVHGLENVPEEACIFASNHSGQIPIDGALLTMCFMLELKNPRLLRGMVERFMMTLPFISALSAKSGAVLGDRQNCQLLLESEQSILVFPEGVRGIAKNFQKFYQLQRFTNGFLRIAAATHCKVVPIAVIGAEEMFPYAIQLGGIAKFLRIPALPVTPLFPLLGIAGTMPLPSPVDIYIGNPIELPPSLSSNASEKNLGPFVDNVKKEIRRLILEGKKNKRAQIPHMRKLVKKLPLLKRLSKK